MGLTAGIVGLPNVGKSTLFNAITKSKAVSANYPFATIEPNVGFVEIKDYRLLKLAEVFKPKSTVFTSFSFTDIAGLVKGASLGEGLGNQFLSHIRECDAICHVVRCFGGSDIIHVAGSVDPIFDIETINLELGLADLDVIEKRLAKVSKKAQLKADKDSVLEENVLSKAKSFLQEGKNLRDLNFTKEEKSLLTGFNLLTFKPMIYVMNVGEDDILEDNEYVLKVKEYANKTNTTALKISAKLEEDLTEFDEEEKQAFFKDYNIEKSGLDMLVQKAYEALGLKTFFTAGEKECRAWTFKDGMKAPECAGLIHTDFEKGFIRAEVTSYQDFETYSTMAKAKENGKLRSEGKEYLFKDGDIVLFRFNV